MFRKRLGYPELKRDVRAQAEAFSPQTILIEDRASGTQLIQELIADGMHAVKKYEPGMDKIMRMHSVTSTIEMALFIFRTKRRGSASTYTKSRAFRELSMMIKSIPPLRRWLGSKSKA